MLARGMAFLEKQDPCSRAKIIVRRTANSTYLQSVLKMSTFVLNMRTTILRSVADVLLGRSRAALLSLLFGHADEWFHLRQIARESGMSAGTAHRELGVMVNLGLVLREPNETSVRFKANTEASVFAELKSLLAKTSGAPELLRAGLGELGDAVSGAFIYGSVARGEERAGSDIDLMIVGSVSLANVLKALRPAIEKLRREVNPTVYTSEEFVRKAQQGHAFIQRVLAEPKIYLIGGAHELGQFGEDRKTASPRADARRSSTPAARARSQSGRRAGRGTQ